MRDEGCVLALGKIFVLVEDEIFVLVRDEGRVLALGEIFVLIEKKIFSGVCFILLGWSGDDGCSVALFGWVGVS